MDPCTSSCLAWLKSIFVSGSRFFAGVSVETSDPNMMGLWRHLLAVAFACHLCGIAGAARQLPKLSDDTTCLTAERECLGKLDAASFCYKMANKT